MKEKIPACSKTDRNQLSTEFLFLENETPINENLGHACL
jgi:hypothetical protein